MKYTNRGNILPIFLEVESKLPREGFYSFHENFMENCKLISNDSSE